MHSDQALVDMWLDRAVLEFEENPLCTQLMRRLALERPELFSRSALRYLGKPGEQTGAMRFMTSLVLRQKHVYDRISDPGRIALDRAMVLFNRLLTLDPSFDVKVAKMLPDRTGVNHSIALEGSRAARAIEVLDAGSRGRRLLPVLSHLADSRDPRLCARATLFIGRRMKSPAWSERQLENPDQRVRANAIECLWGLDTPQARDLMHRCVEDEGNRVAGNALVGLHLVGEPGIIEEVDSMADAQNHLFRATAAWTMGRIGDTAFLPRLTSLVRDDSEMVRGTALRSLIGIRREEAKAIEVALENTRLLPAGDLQGTEGHPEEKEESPLLYVQMDGSNFAAKGTRGVDH